LSGLKCQSCMKQKADLVATTSKLMPQTSLLLCKSCIAAKFEPRSIIIIYGRLNGFDSVAHLLSPQKYVGEAIPASFFVNSSKVK
jgi:hypothetical protein